MQRSRETLIAGVGWIAIFLALAFFGQKAPGLLGTVFFYGGLLLASASAWQLFQMKKGPWAGMSSRYDEVVARHEGREDLCTMEHIVQIFTAWRRENPEGTVGDFGPWFLSFRYSLPGFDPRTSAIQRKTAEFALPFYSRVGNAGGEPSLLAVLGAVSEGERFLVNPEDVLSYWRDSGLMGPVIGGDGVEDIGAAFREAEERFNQAVGASD